MQAVDFTKKSADHPNIRNWVASGRCLVLPVELNAQGPLGNFSIRLDRVTGRLAESMSVARWLGSIPPTRREMLIRERLPQTRQ
jgi:hypothetical protein